MHFVPNSFCNGPGGGSLPTLHQQAGGSSTNGATTSLLVQCFQAYEHAMQHFLIGQAIWYAERMIAEARSSAAKMEATFLLARAHYQDKNTALAYFFLKQLVDEASPQSSQTSAFASVLMGGSKINGAVNYLLKAESETLKSARYLLARCCYDLAQYQEAEEALFGGGGKNDLLVPTSRDASGGGRSSGGGAGAASVPGGAAGLHLLGQIRERQRKMPSALESYKQAIVAGPFMVQALERYTHLTAHFGTLTEQLPVPLRVPKIDEASVGAGLAAASVARDESGTGDERTEQGSSSELRTRVVVGGSSSAASSSSSGPVGPSSGRGSPPSCSAAQGPSVLFSSVPKAFLDEYSFGGPADTTAVRGGAPASRSAGGGATGGTRIFIPSVGRENQNSSSPDDSEHDPFTLARLLTVLAHALSYAALFQQAELASTLTELPTCHARTGYFLGIAAKCCFERGEFGQAEKMFSDMLRLSPRRPQFLEYYSTCLWHLKKDVECAHLAHQALLHWGLRSAPETWCILGNSFSLQKEHETAIKFFKRAIALDPLFAYAYTLCAHEYVANEKFEKAVPMFEQALALDPAQYNAWWGLGRRC